MFPYPLRRNVKPNSHPQRDLTGPFNPPTNSAFFPRMLGERQAFAGMIFFNLFKIQGNLFKPMKSYNIIGIMSGTSLDGLDLCYANFHYESEWNFLIKKATTTSLPSEFKLKLKNLLLFQV